MVVVAGCASRPTTGPEKRDSTGPGRGAGRLWQFGRVHREIRRAAAPHRGANRRRPSRQCLPPVGTRLHDAAPPPEGHRGESGAHLDPQVRNALCEAAVSLVKSADYTMPARSSSLSIAKATSISSKSTPAFRSSIGHRNGHRHRSDQGRNCRSRRREVALQARRYSRYRRSARMPYQCRGPQHGFPAVAGAHRKDHGAGRTGVRFDSHAYPGYVVSPYYDSMIGKLLVHRPTRAEAIRAMQTALGELRIEGIKTTIPRQLEILRHSAFAAGTVGYEVHRENLARLIGPQVALPQSFAATEPRRLRERQAGGSSRFAMHGCGGRTRVSGGRKLRRFPMTSTSPLSSPAHSESTIRKVAILFAGGPAPAANAVIPPPRHPSCAMT